MSACNERPPEGHPFHGSMVACHLRAGHAEPHSWELRSVEPWIARFRNGPCAGEPERMFVVGPVWEEIRLAPMPGPHGWAIVGGSGVPADLDTERWPGEARYRLVETERSEDPIADVVAWYGIVAERPAEARIEDDRGRYWGD